VEEAEPVLNAHTICQHFNKEQLNFLNQTLTQMKTEENTNTSNKYGREQVNANAIVSTIIKYFGSCFSAFNFETWIIDSGASEHMCFDPSSFLFLSYLRVPLNNNIPNSDFIVITHNGVVSLFSDLILHNVLYVPSFKYNLLSIHKLYCQFSLSILFNSNKCLRAFL